MRLSIPTRAGLYRIDFDWCDRLSAVSQIAFDYQRGLIEADELARISALFNAAMCHQRMGYAVTAANCAATCATLDLGAEALDAAERREQDAAHAGRRPWWKRWQIWSKR